MELPKENQLTEIINKLVIEKSLSFEVVEQLKKVVEETEKTKQENIILLSSIELKDEQIKKYISLNEELTTANNEWKSIENSLKAREKEVLNSEHKNELEKLKRENSEKTLSEVKEIVALVFKNSVVRKTIMGSVPNGVDNYGNSRTDYTNTTEEKTEE